MGRGHGTVVGDVEEGVGGGGGGHELGTPVTVEWDGLKRGAGCGHVKSRNLRGFGQVIPIHSLGGKGGGREGGREKGGEGGGIRDI